VGLYEISATRMDSHVGAVARYCIDGAFGLMMDLVGPYPRLVHGEFEAAADVDTEHGDGLVGAGGLLVGYPS
jgi:hypothetical protein